MTRKALVGLFLFSLVGTTVFAQRDEDAVENVRRRFDAFNEAWKARDMDFIRDYFAHDEDMLLFFERRQLRGWDKVETLYENMFAHALPGSVKSTYSNVAIDARGDMAYVAANFHLEVRNPQGETSTDSGRVTVVFERRDDDWVVVHRHTSFQAPPGPQKRVVLHTEPGPLWSPTLEGAWGGSDGETLVATSTYLMAHGIAGLPPSSTYRIADEGLWVTSAGESPRLVEVTRLTSDELSLRLPSGALTLARLE